MLGKTRRILGILAVGLLILLATAFMTAIGQNHYGGKSTGMNFPIADITQNEKISNAFWRSFKSGFASHRDGNAIMGSMTNETVK